MWRDIGYILTEVEVLDKFNRPSISYTEQMVFCNEKSIKGVEFYQGQVAGIKPELAIEIKTIPTDKQTHFKYKDKIYKILRTYTKDKEVIELILTSTLLENKEPQVESA